LVEIEAIAVPLGAGRDGRCAVLRTKSAKPCDCVSLLLDVHAGGKVGAIGRHGHPMRGLSIAALNRMIAGAVRGVQAREKR
jgi:hypothetical protein